VTAHIENLVKVREMGEGKMLQNYVCSRRSLINVQ